MKKILIIIATAIFLAYGAFAYCGDGECEATENCDTCLEDCPIDIMKAPACLLDKEKCDSPTMHYHIKNIVMVLFLIGIFIYLKNKGFIG